MGTPTIMTEKLEGIMELDDKVLLSGEALQLTIEAAKSYAALIWPADGSDPHADSPVKINEYSQVELFPELAAMAIRGLGFQLRQRDPKMDVDKIERQIERRKELRQILVRESEGLVSHDPNVLIQGMITKGMLPWHRNFWHAPDTLEKIAEAKRNNK